MRRMDGCGWNVAAILSVLAAHPPSAQDTSAIDRGVRIGIIYRPGVRPGHGDAAAERVARDSIRSGRSSAAISTTAIGSRSSRCRAAIPFACARLHAARRAVAATTARGAAAAPDPQLSAVPGARRRFRARHHARRRHDPGRAARHRGRGVRREVRAQLPPPPVPTSGWRCIDSPTRSSRRPSATAGRRRDPGAVRLDGKVYQIDQDGAIRTSCPSDRSAGHVAGVGRRRTALCVHGILGRAGVAVPPGHRRPGAARFRHQWHDPRLHAGVFAGRQDDGVQSRDRGRHGPVHRSTSRTTAVCSA